MEDTKLLIDEVNEYLKLTDAQLAGYGLNRARLLSDLEMLKEELADEEAYA